MGDTQWAIVQHSGAGYGNKSGFSRGLEEHMVNSRQAKRVTACGGLVFDTYVEARDYCEDEMYPEGSGLYPAAPGRFSKSSLDGLRIYIPKPMEG